MGSSRRVQSEEERWTGKLKKRDFGTKENDTSICRGDHLEKIHMRGTQDHPAINPLFQQFLLNTCYVPTPFQVLGR